jgi:DNA-binding CsgD family transcriptional regulator
MCETELERPESEATLAALSSEVRPTDPSAIVRAAAQELIWQMRMGCLDLADADTVVELLTAVHDPLIQSSFQSAYSSALALSARYEDALAVASDLEACARRYRLDFALPYAAISAAMAHAGLRCFDEAIEALGEASRLARAGRDSYAGQLAYAVEVRTLAAQGKHESALALLVPELRSALPSIRGEVLGSRALALASVGRTREGEKLLSRVAATSAGIELAVLCPAVRAVAALKTSNGDLTQRVHDLEETAFHRGALDILVATYRATPELLSLLIKVASNSERLVDLTRRIGDADLARAVGLPVDVVDDPVERLTPRERDVYDLVSQGHRYRQVAQTLFISEATVKVHMQHIFDKFQVRSREALMVHAALRRSTQATATRGSVADTSS